MNDIETTYLNILGGFEQLDKHHPAYCRRWLKEKVLSELPHLASVLSKERRKSSVLYSPEACDEDMVDLVLNDQRANLYDMEGVYKTAKLVRKSIAEFTKNC